MFSVASLGPSHLLVIVTEGFERWTGGPVVLVGDAAHATYPVGSSGATQASVDTRKLGTAAIWRGMGELAIPAFWSPVLGNGSLWQGSLPWRYPLLR